MLAPGFDETLRNIPQIFYLKSPLAMGFCEALEDDMLNIGTDRHCFQNKTIISSKIYILLIIIWLSDCNEKAAEFFHRSISQVRGNTSGSMGAPRYQTENTSF